MARLLLFTVCERVIVDEDDQTASLITLFDGISPMIPHGEEFPPDASLPLQWAIVTVWRREPGDEERSFRQKVELVLPDGSVGVETEMEFEFVLANRRNVVRVNGFPVGQEGEYLVRLGISFREDKGEWQEWPSSFEPYPLKVRHNRAEALSPASEQPTPDTSSVSPPSP